MVKPERKRFREKRRRDRVNASFDTLRALLITVDPHLSNRVDISQNELVDRSSLVIKALVEEITRNRQMLSDMAAMQRDKVDMGVP